MLESLPPELVVAGVALLVAGMALAFALGRRTADASHRVKELEGALEDLRSGRAEVEQQLGDYQSRVAEHFTETSEKLHDLTLHYRAVYEHLAKGAGELCPQGFEPLAGGLGLDALAPEAEAEADAEPDASEAPAAETDDAAPAPLPTAEAASEVDAPEDSDISPEDLAEAPARAQA